VCAASAPSVPPPSTPPLTGTPRTTLVNQGKEMVVRVREHHACNVAAARRERLWDRHRARR
jgi:hypothetical protein